MASVTVLDFPAVTDVELTDVLYLLRGTGTDRDKRVALDRILPNSVEAGTTQAIDLSTYYSNLLIKATAAPITLTLNNVPTIPGTRVIIWNGAASGDLTLAGALTAVIGPGEVIALVSDGTAIVEERPTTEIVTDCDAALRSGFYKGSNPSNGPQAAGNVYLKVTRDDDDNVWQVLREAAASGGIWDRVNVAGAWSSWRPIVVEYSLAEVGGLTLSNNVTDATNDIDIATGRAASDDRSDNLILATGLTKQLDAAWAEGTDSGGRDTGSISDNWWSVWLIKRPDTGVVDVLFSLSATSPTMPANYTLKRRIGWILRESGAIVAFRQVEDTFAWDTVRQDRAAAGPGTTARQLLTVSAPVNTFGWFNVGMDHASGAGTGIVWVRETDFPDTAAGRSNATMWLGSVTTGGGRNSVNVETRIRVDGSNQIAFRSANTSQSIQVNTFGWFDRRGKDG
jgi:hypothetical protein